MVGMGFPRPKVTVDTTKYKKPKRPHVSQLLPSIFLVLSVEPGAQTQLPACRDRKATKSGGDESSPASERCFDPRPRRVNNGAVTAAMMDEERTAALSAPDSQPPSQRNVQHLFEEGGGGALG